jgi:hypothetical protein
VVLALAVSLSFGVGVLAGREGEGSEGLRIEGVVQSATSTKREVLTQPAAVSEAMPKQGFVASRTGSKYYLATCSGAKRIKEENKVWFGSREEAERAGYTKASGCAGL